MRTDTRVALAAIGLYAILSIVFLPADEYLRALGGGLAVFGIVAGLADSWGRGPIPGLKPVDNCYVESFHDKFRDECLSTHWFLDLADARRIVRAWREDYNTVRPHSSLGGRTPAEFAATLHSNLELESAHHPTTPT